MYSIVYLSCINTREEKRSLRRQATRNEPTKEMWYGARMMGKRLQCEGFLKVVFPIVRVDRDRGIWMPEKRNIFCTHRMNVLEDIFDSDGMIFLR